MPTDTLGHVIPYLFEGLRQVVEVGVYASFLGGDPPRGVVHQHALQQLHTLRLEVRRQLLQALRGGIDREVRAPVGQLGYARESRLVGGTKVSENSLQLRVLVCSGEYG